MTPGTPPCEHIGDAWDLGGDVAVCGDCEAVVPLDELHEDCELRSCDHPSFRACLDGAEIRLDCDECPAWAYLDTDDAEWFYD